MRPVIFEGRSLAIFTKNGSWSPAPHGFPDSVLVSGDRWRVGYHNALYSSRNKSSRILGVALCREHLLVCDPEVPSHELADTLAHEFAHAVCWTGRQHDPRLAKLSQETEEAIAELFARELVRSGWR